MYGFNILIQNYIKLLNEDIAYPLQLELLMRNFQIGLNSYFTTSAHVYSCTQVTPLFIIYIDVLTCTHIYK